MKGPRYLTVPGVTILYQLIIFIMSNYTQRLIICGADNLEGKLIPAPLDEKNLTTDWIEEFLFDYACTKNSNRNKMCGYTDLYDEDMLCEVAYDDNSLTYKFPTYNYIEIADVETFVERLADFFKESEDLTIKMTYCHIDATSIKPEIYLHFYFRCEE